MIFSNVIPEPRDPRDFQIQVPVGLTPSLPQRVDLRQYAGHIEDQGRVNSCVANATISALEILLTKAGRFEHLSRLFLYWDCRQSYANLRGVDGGSYLSDGFKSAYKDGIPKELTWPYDPAQVNVQPSPEAYAEALLHKVGVYQRVGDFTKPATAQWSLEMVKTTLAMGYPVTFSAYVSDRIFAITATDNLYDPVGVSRAKNVGAHALCIVGYDEAKQAFVVENSWGTSWGDQGYFLFSYRALTDACFDAWTCTAFDGVAFAPEWHFLLNPPMTASITPVPTQYKATEQSVDMWIAFDVAISGGTGPFTYAWTTSDQLSVITYADTQVAKVYALLKGWTPGEARSVTVTCEVSDCSVPTQQSVKVQTLLRITNAVRVKDDIYYLYKYLLNREPDDAGYAYWEAMLPSMGIYNITQFFYNLPEVQAVYGGTSNQDFALDLYWNILKRAPDGEGLTYWIGRLNDGMPRVNVILTFIGAAK